ncbi:hypothetical protein ACJ73_02280 [Blastomyces percursus]|uniref:Uncharacterized protein n=1 Tax=Blastomyces percursus TaxID=1658174 RepID=A0A1J9RFD1_9EURO|nr:hypothetical protein ACJ73_02280 [Blastomyces percursus]
MENSQQSPEESFELGIQERSRLTWDKHRVVTQWLEKVEPHSRARGAHGHANVMNVTASTDPAKVSPRDSELDTKRNTAGSS